MTEYMCRACRGRDGRVVLDLGEQPACDYFPALNDPLPDPVYPLQMWLCSACDLAQLVADSEAPEEPRGMEPLALREQAANAVEQVLAAGWLYPGARAAEYGSPHGGSWLPLLKRHGMSVAANGESADVVLDCFGLMHAADQASAFAERAAKVAPGGVLLVQYHSLATILTHSQWNALRHGHYAYYSAPALRTLLATVGFVPRAAWRFDLYGGTILLAATRKEDSQASPDRSADLLIAEDESFGVREPGHVSSLQRTAEHSIEEVRRWLVARRDTGAAVFGYGAASRAVALLSGAGIDRTLLHAVADASSAKQGRRLPGTDIAVISPGELVTAEPAAVLLLLPDLASEVRQQFPEIEAAGGRWVDIETISSGEVQVEQ